MMDTRYLKRLALKDERGELTPTDRRDYAMLLAMFEREQERLADEYRKSQCVALLGLD